MSSTFRRSGLKSRTTRLKKLDENELSFNSTKAPLKSPSVNTVATKTKYRYRGTKAWTGGMTLTSFGHNEMDVILGGGQPLGTCILIKDDRWTQGDLTELLVKYWLSEGIAQKQFVLGISTKSDECFTQEDEEEENDDNGGGVSARELFNLIQDLPKNLHVEKERKKKSILEANEKAKNDEKDSSSKSMLGFDSNTIIEEEGEEEEEEEDDYDNSDEGLKIAWQYRKDIQKERSGITTSSTSSTSNSQLLLSTEGRKEYYCHSYDLSERMIDQISSSNWQSQLLYTPENNDQSTEQCVDILDCSNNVIKGNSNMQRGLKLCRTILRQIEHHFKRNNQVIRLLLHKISPSMASITLPLLLSYIKTHSIPVIVLTTVQPWLSITSCASRNNQNSLLSLESSSDAVLQIQGFSLHDKQISSEFRDFVGLLHVSKAALFTSCTHYADHKFPPANRYGFKRDRRKLNIKMMHLPPEEYSSSGGSVSSGVRSGAGSASQNKKKSGLETKSSSSSGAGCGSGNSNSLLDF